MKFFVLSIFHSIFFQGAIELDARTSYNIVIIVVEIKWEVTLWCTWLIENENSKIFRKVFRDNFFLFWYLILKLLSFELSKRRKKIHLAGSSVHLQEFQEKCVHLISKQTAENFYFWVTCLEWACEFEFFVFCFFFEIFDFFSSIFNDCFNSIWI